MATCKGCGKEIIWGETADRKKIPLDAIAPVWSLDPVMPLNPEPGRQKFIAVRLQRAYVTHFATCKFANSFSRGRHADKITVDE